MTEFGEHYARYYDLLYRDKPYAEEASYIDRLIQERCPGAKSLLELGCGTGKHAERLARIGYRIDGIDKSPDMLAAARRTQTGEHVRLMQGDIRSFRLEESYDSAYALFHVIGYLTDNDDLIRAFRNIGRHLNRGGVMIFDCWYGPAVLSERPSVRIKRLADERTEAIRLAEPALSVERNTVDVGYRVFVRDTAGGKWTDFEERHCMRYLFTPEVSLFLREGGMALEASFEFMTGKNPDSGTWNVVYVGRKQ